MATKILAVNLRPAANGYVASMTIQGPGQGPMMNSTISEMVFTTLEELGTYLKANGFGPEATQPAS